MGWLESQVETRVKNDAALMEEAFVELAASVGFTNQMPKFSADDMRQLDAAAKACLKYIGVKPGEVPDDMTDAEERIEWLCRPSGTMLRTVRLTEGWQKRAFGAMLGSLDTGETVALLPGGFGGYCYLEPVTGKKVRITSEVAKRINASAILFYRPLPAKPLGPRDLMQFVARVFTRQDYLLVFMAALAVTLIGLAPAWANQRAFGVVAPSGQASLILPIGALLLGVAVSSALLTACRNLVMARVSLKLSVAVEAATFARLMSLPPSFFKTYSSGDLGSRVSTISIFTRNLTSIVLGTGLSMLFGLAYIFQVGVYAPQLALPAFLVAAAQVALIIVITPKIQAYEQETTEASTKLSGTVTALLNGVQKIKLAGAEDRAFAYWARGYARYARVAYNRPAILRALPALVGLIGLLGNVVIYYLAGVNEITVPNFMAFNAAYGQVTVAITAFEAASGPMAQITPMVKIVAPIMEETPEIAEDKPSVKSLGGSIEVSNVSFRYGDNQPYVLNNLSFKVNRGEYVAIVGKSGCGKSTVLRLMLGFEKPDHGAIYYGRFDVQKVDLPSLRRRIGTVMQDGRLFAGDLFSNITISTPSATLDDAWRAAEIAGIADDIRKMPMGMQTLVSEGGGGISGGQRQRIMIARAVCGDRGVLLFDEATSALDNKTQRHVTDALAELDCTRVVVAHRLSTVRHCDRILVLDGGAIAEEGTYDELIAKNGLFAELVKRQRLEESDE